MVLTKISFSIEFDTSVHSYYSTVEKVNDALKKELRKAYYDCKSDSSSSSESDSSDDEDEDDMKIKLVNKKKKVDYETVDDVLDHIFDNINTLKVELLDQQTNTPNNSDDEYTVDDVEIEIRDIENS